MIIADLFTILLSYRTHQTRIELLLQFLLLQLPLLPFLCIDLTHFTHAAATAIAGRTAFGVARRVEAAALRK